jgi:hypothetical protein
MVNRICSAGLGCKCKTETCKKQQGGNDKFIHDRVWFEPFIELKFLAAAHAGSGVKSFI